MFAIVAVYHDIAVRRLNYALMQAQGAKVQHDCAGISSSTREPGEHGACCLSTGDGVYWAIDADGTMHYSFAQRPPDFPDGSWACDLGERA